ncbi:Isochorismatase family protein [Fulvimarina manganoxydans]|uniref:Isochorismatase family protein n=1 Tax=Fulvimarina manganoxydans TaxID=937218 RepID=A0A1W2EMT2_9HYPH|nr:isochorismatase family protein [Fulvimarina manganoxydans]SMD10832.1 Isochorismatase family protein [Fulvimarina manganoxydans]
MMRGLLLAALFALIPTMAFADVQADMAVQRGPAERLTPDNTVLVYVDYTTGLDNLMNTMPGAVYKNNIEAFAKFNPLFKMPTAILGTENDYYGTMLPEITDHVSYDVRRFPRHTMSGYTAEMAEWLRESGRTNVLIGGISIDNCTTHTALDLLHAGYNVYVVVDVSSTNSRLIEDVAITRVVQEGATPIGWLAALTELGWWWDGPYGQGIREIVAEHWAASTVGPVDDTTPGQGGLETFAD